MNFLTVDTLFAAYPALMAARCGVLNPMLFAYGNVKIPGLNVPPATFHAIMHDRFWGWWKRTHMQAFYVLCRNREKQQWPWVFVDAYHQFSGTERNPLQSNTFFPADLLEMGWSLVFFICRFQYAMHMNALCIQAWLIVTPCRCHFILFHWHIWASAVIHVPFSLCIFVSLGVPGGPWSFVCGSIQQLVNGAQIQAIPMVQSRSFLCFHVRDSHITLKSKGCAYSKLSIRLCSYSFWWVSSAMYWW